MATEPNDSANNNPFSGLWSGPNGLAHVLAVLLPALLCAVALQWATEHYVVAPVCTEYGNSRGLTYQGADATHANDVYTSVCRYTKADGTETTVPTSERFPFLTGLWVSFALDLKISVLGFIALAAVAYAVWKKRGASRRKKTRKA